MFFSAYFRKYCHAKFQENSPIRAEMFHADGRTDRHAWRCWQSLCTIFRTHPKTQLYVLLSRCQSMHNFPRSVSVQFSPDPRYRQPPQTSNSLQYRSTALCCTQQQHICVCHRSAPSHAVCTHCWQRTVPSSNSCADQRAGTSVLQRCLPAGIFGEVEHLDSQLLWRVIVKGWQQETTRNRRTGALSGVTHWTAHTAWCPGGWMEGQRHMTSHTWQLSRQSPGAHKYSAPCGPGDCILYSGAYHLWVLSAEPGSCHPLGAWNFKLAPAFMENLCTLV